MGDLKESQNSGPLCSQKPSPLTVLGVSRGRVGSLRTRLHVAVLDSV